MPEQTLIQYIRDYTGQPLATLAAVNVNGEIKVGVAFRNPKDQFNKVLSRNKAAGRALSRDENFEHIKIPNKKVIPSWADPQAGIGKLDFAEVVNVEYLRLLERANKYFFKK